MSDATGALPQPRPDAAPRHGYCESCRFWNTDRENMSDGGYLYPPHDMGRCEAPDIERPHEHRTQEDDAENGPPIAAVEDASGYAADLFTTAKFGCVLWQETTA